MTIRSQVVVELVLVRVRVGAHGGDLVGLLVIEPRVDQILGEHVSLGEELVVLAQRIEGSFKRAGELGDVLILGRRQLVEILVDRRLIPSMPAMRQAEKAR